MVRDLVVAKTSEGAELLVRCEDRDRVEVSDELVVLELELPEPGAARS